MSSSIMQNYNRVSRRAVVRVGPAIVQTVPMKHASTPLASVLQASLLAKTRQHEKGHQETSRGVRTRSSRMAADHREALSHLPPARVST